MQPADLLMARRLPARLTTEQVAVLLNIHEHDVPMLIKAGILTPLATASAPNTVKYFAAVQVEALSQNVPALTKLTRTLQQYWRKSNLGKQVHCGHNGN